MELTVDVGQMHHYLKPFDICGIDLKHKTLSSDDAQRMRERAMFNNRPYEGYGMNPGVTITVLRDDYDVIMSDTGMEMLTNFEFMQNANGKVLIAGLGIGFTLLNIQDKPEVEEIHVIEMHQALIDKVGGQLPLNDKVVLHHGDIFRYKPGKQKFDCIWFDIWNNAFWENWPEMKYLHRKFGRYLNRQNPKAFMDSWRRIYVKRQAKENQMASL